MKKITSPTLSFIILFFLAVFGSFLCLSLWSGLRDNYQQNLSEINYNVNNPSSSQVPAVIAASPQPVVDTSTWKTYTNKTYNFSFKYKPDWKVLAITEKDGYKIIQVDPGKKYYNFKIYISTQDFFALGGLPTKDVTIGGQVGVNIADLLFGVKNGDYYYTFDLGSSSSLKPDFGALVYSVKFEN